MVRERDRAARRRSRPHRAAGRDRRDRRRHAHVRATSRMAVVTSDFGVYVHVPFCSRRCDYCAFATWSDRHHLHDQYLDAVRVDIERAVTEGRLVEATSVFVGGGTPSLVDPHRLADVLAVIPTVADVEMTVECNPESVTARHVEAYRAVGVDRLSFGVQSMVPHVLVSLGRDHETTDVKRAVSTARAGGIERLNLDLIYGASTESLDDWRTTLERIIGLGPDHVSAYALTVEAGTPLADDPARHPDDDQQADAYLLAEELLSAAGYGNYEISNWARPGQECRHNLLYWDQGDYLGFGCAAHSHLAGRRWWNVRTPERYIAAVRDRASTEAAAETLDGDRRRLEGLQLALRTTAGVPRSTLDAEDLESLGDLLVVDGDRVRLSVEGRLLANEIAVRLR
ncbi:MAG: radical SAM family heme chaperone HemW [Acidimicrobiia bacterium]|nr:radical SAM family heme chaperone HemW [Acidimicrobiia bacterium]